MKRRTFVGSVLAALAAPMLPASELAAPDITLWNTSTLTSFMEKMFACQVGPASKFFDLSPAGVVTAVPMAIQPHPQFPNQPNAYFSQPAGVPEGLSRHSYVTYVCAVKGGTAEEAEARLAKHFYDQFSQLPAGQLVWRLKPHFESGEVVEYGDTVMTHEMVEDRPDLLKEIPPGVELDFATNSYRYVKEKYMLHKMRMRVAMPHLEDALPELVKEEGSMINHVLV